MLLNTTTIAGGGVLKNDLAKRGILSHFINVLSCYCTLLCSQPFVIFNYLCLPCDCIFAQLFSVLLIVFATNIISFLFWDWGFTQHTQQRECAHMQSKPPRASTPANFQTQFISLQTWTGRYFPSPNQVANAMCQTEPQTKLDSDHLNINSNSLIIQIFCQDELSRTGMGAQKKYKTLRKSRGETAKVTVSSYW